jgi:hypothetical protein
VHCARDVTAVSRHHRAISLTCVAAAAASERASERARARGRGEGDRKDDARGDVARVARVARSDVARKRASAPRHCACRQSPPPPRAATARA